ncbi:unnamed protein product [Prorocentrum cordatum]|uniref:DOMON domain-containing protein n=1 Tax=Prorocentrum cordatum TaxID=2364126 RepID=A0ABN9TM11_9DINO|nr:unnamed protein product [Polarella glacialis]
MSPRPLLAPLSLLAASAPGLASLLWQAAQGSFVVGDLDPDDGVCPVVAYPQAPPCPICPALACPPCPEVDYLGWALSVVNVVVTAMAQVGEYIMIRYNLEDDDVPLYHEAFITGVKAGPPNAVTRYTPSGDHYELDLTAGDDIYSVHWLGDQGASHPGTRNDRCYRFARKPTAAAERALISDSLIMLGGVAQQRPPVRLAAAPGEQVGGLARVPAQQAGPVPQRTPPGRAWVVAEDVGSLRRGEVAVDLHAESRVLGNKAVMPTADGDVVLVRQIGRKDLDEYIHDDSSVLPVRFDGTGELIARRLQLIEDAHAHNGAGGAADYSAAGHYMGWELPRRPAGAALADSDDAGWRSEKMCATKPHMDAVCAPFFVAKKSGYLRLEMGCRVINLHIRPPPHLDMGTGGPGQGALEMLEEDPHFQDVPNDMLDKALWRGDISTRRAGLPSAKARKANRKPKGAQQGTICETPGAILLKAAKALTGPAGAVVFEAAAPAPPSRRSSSSSSSCGDGGVDEPGGLVGALRKGASLLAPVLGIPEPEEYDEHNIWGKHDTEEALRGRWRAFKQVREAGMLGPAVRARKENSRSPPRPAGGGNAGGDREAAPGTEAAPQSPKHSRLSALAELASRQDPEAAQVDDKTARSTAPSTRPSTCSRDSSEPRGQRRLVLPSRPSAASARATARVAAKAGRLGAGHAAAAAPRAA